METIVLKTFSMQGKISVGTGAVETRLPALLTGQKNFVVTDENVMSLYAPWFKKWFDGVEIFVLPAGEEYKNFQSLYAILEKMAGAGMRRTSRLFAVGGGVVGDIGGLAAALYMRGISYVQIPTTLLAQVDSSVGGKTAVDLGGVKNVVGAFHQPCEVLVDPTFLKTLPTREIKCGLGEVIKYAALNAEIFDLLEENTDKWTNLDFLEKLIPLCIRHKARVVEADEKENDARRCLNVGHTTGHVVELACGSGCSHGACVLYGMLFETKMAMAAGVCERGYGNRLLNMVKKAIAVNPCEKIDFSHIAQDASKARLDKKNKEDGNVNMSVVKSRNEWTTLSLPFEKYCEVLQSAVRELLSEN